MAWGWRWRSGFTTIAPRFGHPDPKPDEPSPVYRGPSTECGPQVGSTYRDMANDVISAFDFLSYCLIHGIMSLVMSQYGDPTCSPYSVHGPRYTGIGFIWIGVRMAGAWTWVLESDVHRHPYVSLPMADPILLAGVLSLQLMWTRLH